LATKIWPGIEKNTALLFVGTMVRVFFYITKYVYEKLRGQDVKESLTVSNWKSEMLKGGLC
jgi:hypothetical protein